MATKLLADIEPSAGVTSNLRKKLPAIIIGSMSLVVGLSWNEAIKSIIDQYIPEKYRKNENALAKIIYATVLTIIVIIIVSFMIEANP